MKKDKRYEPRPGDRIRIHKRGMYGRTPRWTSGYCGEVLRVNKSGSVTVRLDDYPEERHYIDPCDLIPEEGADDPKRSEV